MWIRVDNQWTTIAKSTSQELAWLKSFLTYEDPQRERQTGNGEIRLLNARHRGFHTGLVPYVEKHARARGFEVRRIDVRQRPHDRPWEELAGEANLDWLKSRALDDGRRYQYDALTEALASGRGILRLPTGSGKGELVVGLAKSLPIKWLFLVHRAHLAEDIERRWVARGDGSGHAWLGSKHGWELGERITFCTYQTLYASISDPRCTSQLAKVQGLIGDEIHVVAADSFSAVSETVENAYYRIGLSGTPLERTDGRSLMAIAQTGPVIYNVLPRELMDAGYVAKATVRVRTVKQTTTKRQYTAVRKALVAESKTRNAAVLDDLVKCAKPAIAFTSLLSHGRILYEAAQSAGLEVALVHGRTPLRRREELVNQLNSGLIDAIICNDVFKEGVDAPNIVSVLNAAGEKSSISTIQRVGRGSRVTGDKDEFDIYDYMDKGQKWLAEHSKERIRTYQRYGYSVVMV